jgi:hypothetical protein
MMIEIVRLLLEDPFIVRLLALQLVTPPLLLWLLWDTIVAASLFPTLLLIFGVVMLFLLRKKSLTRAKYAAIDARFFGGAPGRYIPLSQREEHMLEVPSPTVAIFIKAQHVEALAEYLTTRFSDIVDANPWLSGRLRSDPARSGAPSL